MHNPVTLCRVRSSLVVPFAAITLQGSRFKPRPGQKSETRFLLHVHPCSASGTTTSDTIAIPKPGNSPKRRVSEKGTTDGCRRISRKEETRMKFNDRRRRENGKTLRYGRRRQRRWTPTWAKAQDTRASPNSLETHLVRK